MIASMTAASTGETLLEFLREKRRLFVLTGAGCSTASGIPDYRDDAGAWKHKQPIKLQQFVGSEAMRKRYWARSRVGWKRIRDARPNSAHEALAQLEQRGRVGCLVTQNVDGLHRRAGSTRLVELHGRLDLVDCMECRTSQSRDDFQTELIRLNPEFDAVVGHVAPDGDVDLGAFAYDRFHVPACHVCGGMLKPAVVFFGESVPAERVQRAYEELHASDGLLVVGSSLMVFSGYRFVRAAAKARIPIAIVNRGRTRADDLADALVRADCTTVLPELVDAL